MPFYVDGAVDARMVGNVTAFRTFKLRQCWRPTNSTVSTYILTDLPVLAENIRRLV